MNKSIWIIVILIIAAIVIFGGWQKQQPAKEITSYEECVAAGNPVMESYPPQCAANGRTFTQNIGNEVSKMDKIQITTPRPNTTITSPLRITGKARGPWFFEASFPVILKNSSGQILAQGIAQAEGEWMTEDFVPFISVLNYPKNQDTDKRGVLILQKSNASGEPEHDDALEIPVVIN